MTRSDESRKLETLVRERIDRWRAGDEPDAAGTLAEHPELLASKSLVLDLALEEFSLRTAAGDAVAHGDFCDQFPAYRQSLAKLLEVQEFLDEFPQFAAADDAARWPAVGDEFLGYEIVEPLGRGGWARVFLARETAVGQRYVVIKVSQFGSCEAQTLGKLSHPSIVPIHSVHHDDDDDWTVICMPLVGVATAVDLLDAAFAKGARRDGLLIARVARETRPLEPVPLAAAAEPLEWRLPYAEAIARMGLQLAQGLAAAHAAGILHRDIKPSNILLAWSGRPMLLDFNLATDGSASAQTVAGTLPYMAPELVASLLSGRAAAGRGLDPRCDVYSLGAVLYELLAGRLPVQPDDVMRLPEDAYGPWLECKRQQPKSLVAAEAGAGEKIDPRLSAIVLKCLAFEAAERYESGDSLAAALQKYLGGSARAGRFVKRHRRAILAAAVGLLGSGALLRAYIGSRPSELELLYRRGLDEYEAQDFTAAAATFTKCLELRSGWANALFGRGQALRRMGKWPEARTDYEALRSADAAWSFAFEGYCRMQMNDDRAAWSDFTWAYRHGLRDVDFLLNFARMHTRRQMHAEAAQTYSEVLALDSNNRTALRNRAMAYLAAVRNDKKKIPDAQAFVDVAEYRRLEPDGFEAAYCAAIIHGEAARKDAAYEDDAIGYLTEALKDGMPLELVQAQYIQLKRLLPFVDAQVVAAARRDPNYRTRFVPDEEPSLTANWDAFRERFGSRMLARGK